jgi:hypothetical protein
MEQQVRSHDRLERITNAMCYRTRVDSAVALVEHPARFTFAHNTVENNRAHKGTLSFHVVTSLDFATACRCNLQHHESPLEQHDELAQQSIHKQYRGEYERSRMYVTRCAVQAGQLTCYAAGSAICVAGAVSFHNNTLTGNRAGACCTYSLQVNLVNSSLPIARLTVQAEVYCSPLG